MAKKVLIIDDDPSIVSYLQDILQDAGYATAVATNGLEAMDKLESEKPDLITLDIEMPEMSGPKFNRALTKDGKAKGVPIIVVTGHMGLKYTIPNAVAEFDKPFDKDVLVGKVREIIGK
ncbi:response regulator receiver protein [Desulfovibrio sp. X2]|uniref:response regulator n=1 Tax=Desulfovibrio sp. X2 TaxID=941449 RepID=UPI000358D940|nr:response regulator [Desulfovibrio sp. X2]EPR37405.1 response regulator receiver protein [Desulfovibrio sp. X2]